MCTASQMFLGREESMASGQGQVEDKGTVPHSTLRPSSANPDTTGLASPGNEAVRVRASIETGHRRDRLCSEGKNSTLKFKDTKFLHELPPEFPRGNQLPFLLGKNAQTYL